MCFPGNVADCQFCLSLLVQRPCMLNWDFLHYKYNSKLSYYKYESGLSTSVTVWKLVQAAFMHCHKTKCPLLTSLLPSSAQALAQLSCLS